MTLSYRTPDLLVTDHEFSVPLDHARPDGEHLSVFARELADPEGKDRPYLVYFQGGPGYEAFRPISASGWLKRALKDYRVLLLDQRGTGRSTPVGTLPGLTDQQQAEYLTHFRADSIVRDAELIRQALGVEQWSVMGQSFGGFCVVTYLSFAPGCLKEAFITGGLPPLARPTGEVYRATYKRVAERNRLFFERYPHNLEKVRDLLARLSSEPAMLPGGDRLTPQRFRTLGQMLGTGKGPERLNVLLDLPPDSPAFLHDVEASFPFSRNPLYAVIHESCYADGGATNWAAQREYPADFPAHFLTGEMVYPWMFEEASGLKPLAGAAELLARHPWPRLYDEAQLRANTVPVAALAYADDMYVERTFSEETAAAIGNLRLWLTNEYQHDGIHEGGERVMNRLIALVRGPR